MLKKLYLEIWDGQEIQKVEAEVVYSDRKSLGLEVSREGTVRVRAPKRASDLAIQSWVEEKKMWIARHYLEAMARREEAKERGVPDYVRYPALEEKYRRQAREKLSQRTAYFARQMGVSYGRITVRAAKTRWGSCSSRKNLNFNYKLAYMPQEIMDYVVVHELAHLRHMNHSREFWELVEQYIPDYRERRKWLKEHGQEY